MSQRFSNDLILFSRGAQKDGDRSVHVAERRRPQRRQLQLLPGVRRLPGVSGKHRRRHAHRLHGRSMPVVVQDGSVTCSITRSAPSCLTMMHFRSCLH